VTFPLLADFHPKGEVIQAYGLWHEDRGVSRRAVVIIDPNGVVAHSEVIPEGPPDVERVLARVQALAGASQ
jgi:alkyl hydroperoxide reductase subunit AhpC